jgi:hypothetical protein
MRHLDAVIAIYFRGRHEATDGEDWREEARQWLITQGSAKEDIETYVEAVERYADFLTRYAFLYCPTPSPPESRQE